MKAPSSGHFGILVTIMVLLVLLQAIMHLLHLRPLTTILLDLMYKGFEVEISKGYDGKIYEIAMIKKEP